MRFAKQGKVFGEHVALMLGIASKSGEMTSIFKSVAILVERQAEFKKGLLSALIMPAITSLTVLGAIVFLRGVSCPQDDGYVGTDDGDNPASDSDDFEIPCILKRNYEWMTAICVVALGAIYGFLLTEQGKLWRGPYDH